ncbi:putative glycolipid-binding domain-containing protein [Shinella zoogloeoides]|uniref:putative glycolipid-binding domain-containing protein n=1 Tax=Shinella zoogloeoides TaxID=352475 RepID=UPI0028AD2239|nr:putative glycolipid-binding domain-containing protein [Shinella zoogloeoides]
MFPPLALKTVRWRPFEGEGLEHLTVRAVGDGLRAESTVIGEQGNRPFGVHYRIDLDAAWRVRSFLVEGMAGRRIAMLSDGDGRWRDEDGTPLPVFDGCMDIDLAGSPFTNTLPIRRLGLSVEHGRTTLKMVYVPFDTFVPFVDGQHYTCLSPASRYLYEAADRSFSAELPVDADGFVTDYPTLFARL